jgi:hypothetical protein
MRPIAFGEALPADTRLTLFSDDKPDRFFTKFWMDKTSGVALPLKTGVPTCQVEDEEGRTDYRLMPQPCWLRTVALRSNCSFVNNPNDDLQCRSVSSKTGGNFRKTVPPSESLAVNGPDSGYANPEPFGQGIGFERKRHPLGGQTRLSLPHERDYQGQFSITFIDEGCAWTFPSPGASRPCAQV